MGIQERELLAASAASRVVDVEDIAVRRCDPARELIDERARHARRIRLRRRVLEPADGRLRGQGRARLRAAADRHLQGWIVAQAVVVDAVFVAAADAEHARADDLAEPVADARRIAPVGQRGCEPRDNADFLLGGAQRQQPTV